MARGIERFEQACGATLVRLELGLLVPKTERLLQELDVWTNILRLDVFDELVVDIAILEILVRHQLLGGLNELFWSHPAKLVQNKGAVFADTGERHQLVRLTARFEVQRQLALCHLVVDLFDLCGPRLDQRVKMVAGLQSFLHSFIRFVLRQRVRLQQLKAILPSRQAVSVELDVVISVCVAGVRLEFGVVPGVRGRELTHRRRRLRVRIDSFLFDGWL